MVRARAKMGRKRLRNVTRPATETVTFANASPEVYDVFEMTGLTQVMDVRRRMRELSLDGLEFVARGANGEVWRIDDETMIKVYNVGTDLEKIHTENQHATAAFMVGVPCAIAFDTVRVGDRYGIVFELFGATTVGRAVSADPARISGRDCL